MSRRLADADLADRPFILIHPTATLFTKQWELSKFARLVDYLWATYGLPLVLTVSNAERPIAQQIQRAAHAPPAVLDDLPLDDLMAVIERAALFIGCDSGPTHLAAALKKKIVVIFGSSNAVAWRPWRTSYELLQSDLPCIPCPGYRCDAFGEPKCILGISVETVAAAVDRLMKISP
jgi:ADP-heptose:LPS heptosyltransferase